MLQILFVSEKFLLLFWMNSFVGGEGRGGVKREYTDKSVLGLSSKSFELAAHESFVGVV